MVHEVQLSTKDEVRIIWARLKSECARLCGHVTSEEEWRMVNVEGFITGIITLVDFVHCHLHPVFRCARSNNSSFASPSSSPLHISLLVLDSPSRLIVKLLSAKLTAGPARGDSKHGVARQRNQFTLQTSPAKPRPISYGS